MMPVMLGDGLALVETYGGRGHETITTFGHLSNAADNHLQLR